MHSQGNKGAVLITVALRDRNSDRTNLQARLVQLANEGNMKIIGPTVWGFLIPLLD